MKFQPRSLLLGSVLVASLAAAVWVGSEEEELAEDDRPRKTRPNDQARQPTAPRTMAAAEPAAGVALPEASGQAEAEGTDGEAAETGIDPFRSKSWVITPPPPPPPKPTAPPLPFRFLGRLVEDGETRVFLAQQNQNLSARVGDVINGTYSVEAIGDTGVRFVYLPLKETQVLPLSQVN